MEYATLDWVDWFNDRRLLEAIGNIQPAEAEAEAEANSYAALETEPIAARLTKSSPPANPEQGNTPSESTRGYHKP